MCLAIPGRIRSIAVDAGGLRTATIDYPGLEKTASLLYLPEAAVGDYILVQAGFGIRRLTPDQAAEVRAALEEGLAGAGPASSDPVGGAP
jgi:hydrogenase expression/formation protein HypC